MTYFGYFCLVLFADKQFNQRRTNTEVNNLNVTERRGHAAILFSL